MKITKEFLEENIHKFTETDLSGFDCENLGIVIIKDEGWVFDNYNDQVRVTDEVDKRTNMLTNSMNAGIDFTQPVPVVTKTKEGKYLCKDGFGRQGFIEKQPYYVAQLIEVKDEFELIIIRSYLNRNLPKTPNTDNDIMKIVKEGIRLKKIKDHHLAIDGLIKRIEPYLPQAKVTELRNKVKGSKVDVPTRFADYTSATLNNNWCNTHWNEVSMSDDDRKNKVKKTDKFSLKYKKDQDKALMKVGGKLNCFKDYISRTVITAIDKFHTYKGLETEILFYFNESFKDGEELHNARLKAVLVFDKIVNNLESVGANLSFISIKGFVPQDTENEDVKSVITVEEVKRKNEIPSDKISIAV